MKPLGRRALMIFLAVAVVLILVTGSLAYLVLNQPTFPPRPSLGPAGLSRATSGSLGCRSSPDEVCYAVEFGCTYSQLPIWNLFFAASNATGFSYPIANTAYLGPGARVTVLNGSSANGEWNISSGRWTVQPVGFVPTNSLLVVVLDTGVLSNSSLIGTWFFVEHSLPTGGAIGLALGYS